MLIPISSIQQHFEDSLDVNDISEKLTMVGIEVDSVNKCDFESLDNKIVVGQIKNIKKHPNADKLQICEVDTKDELLSIICGASNINNGDIVPVAKIGSKLPNGLKIKKSKIRDQESFGMLCSLDELGQPYQMDNGILIMSTDFEIGEPINKSRNLNDYILDIGITPNRGDCLSSLGIAREISSIIKKNIKSEYDYKDFIYDLKSDSNKLNVTIDSDDVRRYCLAKIDNLIVTKSPFWLKNSLAKFGISSVNNLVDATNYFMITTGQPLHAFDSDLIDKSKIHISDKIDSEIETLSNDICKTKGSLSIFDGSGPIAVAGVVGGKRTSISHETKCIFLECASFEPSAIRKSSKNLNITTDSSFRFERDISEHLTAKNLEYAIQLIKKLCGGDLANEFFDSSPDLKYEKKVSLNLNKIPKRIGIDIEKNKIIKILASININMINDENDHVIFSIPPYRTDINYDHDLIEEIARINGLNSIPNITPKIPISEKPKSNFSSKRILKNKLRTILSSVGLSEVINFSFIDNNKFSGNSSNDIKILNPLSNDTATLRNSTLQSLLGNALYNINRGSESVAIFEISKVFDKNYQNNECLELGIVSSVARNDLYWDKAEVGFYDLKGIIQKIFSSLSINPSDISYDELSKEENKIYHPGKSTKINILDNTVGSLGEIHPKVLQQFQIKKPIIGALINLDLLDDLVPSNKQMNKFSNFPQVKRDFSLIMDSTISAGKITDEISNLNIDILKDVKIFDSFKSSKFGDDKISLSFSLTFESTNKTLEDAEIVEATDSIIKSLQNKFNFEVRN
mgnify:FL=1|tara:strand:+ start:7856 stop:10255 length:2400 start_codon:yes stop_codon:yes gene_type:complete